MLRATCPCVVVVMVPLFVKVITNWLVTPQLEPVAAASVAVAVGTAVAAPDDALPMRIGVPEKARVSGLATVSQLVVSFRATVMNSLSPVTHWFPMPFRDRFQMPA